MKKLLLILLLLPALAWGGEPIEIARMNPYILGSGGSAAPAEDCTPAGSYTQYFVESFGDGTAAECYSGAGGTTCEQTWSINGDSTTIATLPSGAPTGSCTKGLYVDTSNENSERVYIDFGTAIDASATKWDLQYTFYVDDATIGTGTSITMVMMDTDDTPGSSFAGCALKNNAGTWEIWCGLSPNVAIALDTWYTLRYHNDTTLGAASMQITGGSLSGTCVDTPCTFNGSTSVDPEYLHIGSLGGEGAGELMKYYIGYILIETE